MHFTDHVVRSDGRREGGEVPDVERPDRKKQVTVGLGLVYCYCSSTHCCYELLGRGTTFSLPTCGSRTWNRITAVSVCPPVVYNGYSARRPLCRRSQRDQNPISRLICVSCISYSPADLHLKMLTRHYMTYIVMVSIKPTRTNRILGGSARS